MQSPSKTNIQEANMHLQMLHARVKELERNISRQTNDYALRDQEKQIHFEELIKIKDAEIQKLKDSHRTSENTISELRLKLRESDKLITDLHEKGRVFDEILQCKPILESMVKLMNVYQTCETESREETSLKEDQSSPQNNKGKNYKASAQDINESQQITPSPQNGVDDQKGNTMQHDLTLSEMYL